MNYPPPYTYTAQKSLEILQRMEKFFQANNDYRELLENLGWTYLDIWRLVPETTQNLWSGHVFPLTESWCELQLSLNLLSFGFYKQAFVSLRSGLELGMLSVYFNIEDNGHETVSGWIRARENTPRTETIWKKLKMNQNICDFEKKHKLRQQYNDFGFLHNYVHSAGYKFSNRSAHHANSQNFNKKMVVKWIESYKDIVQFITILHLLKYPIGLIEYEWSRKCGIDNPFPVLEIHNIERIKELLPQKYHQDLLCIAQQDKETQDLFSHIKSLPDMTHQDIEEQRMRLDKIWIEMHPEGFIGWEKQEQSNMKFYSLKERQQEKERIAKLKKWAKKCGLMKVKGK